MKILVGEDNHLVLEALDDAAKEGVVAVSAATADARNLSVLVQENEPLRPHNPAVVAFPLACEVPFTSSLAPEPTGSRFAFAMVVRAFDANLPFVSHVDSRDLQIVHALSNL